ncbi:hypothetical protein FRAHR75_770040 [Frankia sp. Hr75.2]|nr:hypothetical protein FRAHR75_770040 [Frankia sp. Hr75.2]
MADEATLSFRQVVGEGVRRVREATGARQDDVAVAARKRGLTWSRQKVAMLERGSKPVSVEELVILLELLTEVCRRPVGLGELIAPDTRIALSPEVAIGGREMVQILGGEPSTIGTELMPGLVVTGAPEPRVPVGPFAVTRSELDGWLREAGEVEANAARRIGVPLAVFVTAARFRFGRGFTLERDARAQELYDDAGPDRRRGLRSRMSRELTQEVADLIRKREAEAAGTGLGGPAVAGSRKEVASPAD